ncbi:glycerophosphoryl diester phosphodiesterase [Capnocytophaga catalasegens]|uniref:Glycerophosphoryl diester phosphodiesterase n=2 Tax=Capnocytophaga catalasegens TaxID=1004260 RepID=A0AAV5AW67_9FLAO|nr:glycerophosphoryl diester phosphodiesterase [Capnocytophaga catalasegens]GJM49910.1 glycerophosphoryl diester phosphodiesterase [Capnocytophaga catalasegens]GJM54261.1 glycerophosphoryl diester phosphodiesterase [Capnocytophaga catalasegens]
MVVAHRGDWREAPENSLWAIKKAYKKGANMVEIDLAITKDSVLILMHDKLIDRTTTGKGKPSDYTLAEIQQFYLRDGAGHPTEMRIPTLEQALEVAKGKVFLNLDKAFQYFDLVYPLVKKWDMEEQVLYKGKVSYEEFNQKYGTIKDKIHFMPVIWLEKGQGWDMINDYIANYNAYEFEFTVGDTEQFLIDFASLRRKGFRVWVNSLWFDHNAHHNDDNALENPNIYDWYVKNQVNIVQIDRIKELVSYLKRKKLHQKP